MCLLLDGSSGQPRLSFQREGFRDLQNFAGNNFEHWIIPSGAQWNRIWQVMVKRAYLAPSPSYATYPTAHVLWCPSYGTYLLTAPILWHPSYGTYPMAHILWCLSYGTYRTAHILWRPSYGTQRILCHLSYGLYLMVPSYGTQHIL